MGDLRFVTVIAIYLLGTALYGGYVYESTKQRTLEEIDNRLLVAAGGLDAVLGEAFHDRVLTRDSETKAASRALMKRLGHYNRSMGTKYVYSLIKRDNLIYFTSSNPTEEELADENFTIFLYPYEEANPEDYSGFEQNAPFFFEAKDRWGHFRSIRIPRTTPGGYTYLLGADVTMDEVAEQLNYPVFEALATALFFLLIILPGINFYLRERSKIEQQLGEFNQQLEQQVEERTTELLIATRAKDEFLASMSHELRTPLTSILGYCDVLLDEQKDLQQIKYLHAIRSSGEGQLALVNDILDMSKIQSGKFTIEQLPFSLQALIEEIQSMFAVKAQDAGLVLHVDQQQREPFRLLGDAQRIKQVLLNLIGNAIKFTESGSVKLSVFRNGDELQFDVIDTGVGIQPKNMEKLFQRFQQEDGTISRRYGGTGLGLFISRSLAEMMGGAVTAESVVGEGSVFSLRIPYQKTDQEDRFVAELRNSRASSSQPLQGTILLVEDTPLLQQLIKRMLIKLGLDVETADNGSIAVEKAMDRSYDLVLMDMQMPVMDGIEATQVLRERGFTCPIIALTANVMQKHQEQFKAAGCDGFLGKPIDRETLKLTLETFLKPDEEETGKLDILPIEWQPEYSVGAPLMDQHHQSIIALINQLIEHYSEGESGGSKQRIGEILIQLNQYADTHLKTEEELLEVAGYAELEAHRLLHEKYRRMISSFYEFEPNAGTVGEFIVQLREWWYSHILKEDMAYKPFVESRPEVETDDEFTGRLRETDQGDSHSEQEDGLNRE